MIRNAFGRFKNIPRDVHGLLTSKAVILLYHRVAELAFDPWSMAVTPQHFAEHMEILRKHCHPLSLTDLVARSRSGTQSRNAVAVTFDDGYADVFQEALPVLEHCAIPAAVFLPTASIGALQEFWWDELERILFQPEKLPDRLEITMGGATTAWDLVEPTRPLDPMGQNVTSRWHANQEAPTIRHVLYLALWDRLHQMPYQDRLQLLGVLADWAGAGGESRLSHRTLTPSQISALQQSGLFEIGAHSVTHTSLASLPVEAQKDEIQNSRQFLQETFGVQVQGFSYPFGKWGDLSKETVELVNTAGYTHACINEKGVVRRSTDPLLLPRLYVHDWDGDQFEDRLRAWLRIGRDL